ncbi:9361_t:CDS:2, partial [Acaulospora colombiana]
MAFGTIEHLATLQDLPFGKSTLISSFEEQGDSSADQRGMDEVAENQILQEQYDDIKLLREANDGMYNVHKSCKPKKEEFGIVGVQVAGQTMRLNVLMRDNADIHRYYHILEAK